MENEKKLEQGDTILIAGIPYVVDFIFSPNCDFGHDEDRGGWRYVFERFNFGTGLPITVSLKGPEYYAILVQRENETVLLYN